MVSGARGTSVPCVCGRGPRRSTLRVVPTLAVALWLARASTTTPVLGLSWGLASVLALHLAWD